MLPTASQMPELTWPAVLAGVILGIIFGASSLYLVLKVGHDGLGLDSGGRPLDYAVSRACRRCSACGRPTILENNIVQTTGSAGESIAFGVGVTIPALLLLGFDMGVVRVMTVGALGGLLGILMMIPLRRAFIVQQHGKLTLSGRDRLRRRADRRRRRWRRRHARSLPVSAWRSCTNC